MLARRAAEADEAVALRDVVAARDGDALDRVRHLLDRDGEQTLGEGFGGNIADFGGHRRGSLHAHRAGRRLVADRTDNWGGVPGLDLSEAAIAMQGRGWR